MSMIRKRELDGEIVLSARNVTKIYGATHALKGVNFDIHCGKVTTLFGENGAGKSTLMKILSGIEQPSSGTIELDGKHVTFDNATDASKHGISIIHQELSLAPNLNVRDNIFMGRELSSIHGVDFIEEARQVTQLMARLEELIEPLTLVNDLRLGQQQIIEIARALLIDSRILIMDEPTSALSANDVEILFRVICDLTSRGVSIVYISHHIEEALQITDYAVVLRDGVITATADSKDIDLQWIVRNMVGEHYSLGSPPGEYKLDDVVLKVNQVCIADESAPDRLIVDHVSFDIHAGEIVCIYGLMGAGRTEMFEALAGRIPLISGQILLEGKDISHLPIAKRISAGLALVPEDRQRDGLIHTMTVGKNLSLASINSFVRGLFLSGLDELTSIDKSIRNVQVKTASGNAPIGSLSGGNQQKVVIGKMLAIQPKILLLDEPSRGIDIGAKAEVFALLSEHARQGLGILFSTSEVSECFSIAHRIVVMHRGQISAEFRPDASKEQIMAASGASVDITAH